MERDDRDEVLRQTQRLLLDAEALGRTGSWEMDLRTGAVITTDGNRRLFFGDHSELGANLDDYAVAVHPDDRDWVMRRRQELLDGVGDPAIEYRVVWPDGSVHTIVGLQQVVRDPSGAPIRTYGSNADITEQKRDQAALARMQQQLMLADRMVSVGALAAGVGHEINNPLAFVLANLDFALEQLASVDDLREVRAALVEARVGVDRVRAIAADLKTFARPEETRLGPVDVNAILESSLHMASSAIDPRARVTRRYGAVPPVTANDARLGQVFLNLVINAAHAIPEGAPEANQIVVATATDPEGRVVITVRDTGVGMTAEVRDRIFDPFFTTKPVGEGTGLGLSISHDIVAALGGEITVASEPGKGTEIRVVLPATRGAQVAAPAVASPVAGRRKRVLVVDDEPDLLRAIRRTLGDQHEVAVIDSAREALAMIAGGARFDLILCDLMMPEMTGMALHDELARVDPEQAARMLFLTGGAFTQAAREFLARVPNRRLEKPFDAAELRRAVARD